SVAHIIPKPLPTKSRKRDRKDRRTSRVPPAPPAQNTMKSSPRGLAAASTAAILLGGSPGLCHAGSLRRSGESADGDSTATVRVSVALGEGDASSRAYEYRIMNGMEDGFEVISDSLHHEPLIIMDGLENDWSDRPPGTEIEDEEELSEGKLEELEEYINDEHLNVEGGWDHDWHHHASIAEEGEEGNEEELQHEGDAGAPKEHLSNVTWTFADPKEPLHGRREQTCASNERLWFFKFLTDHYGYETSWRLERRASNGAWRVISKGPPGFTKYHDDTIYQGRTCLPGGQMYRLRIIDAAKDGFCCAYGTGFYSFKVDDNVIFDSKKKKTYTNEASHTFYVGMPLNNDNGSPFAGRTSVCGANKSQIRIKIWTDKFGKENTWQLRSVATGQVIRQRGLNYYSTTQKTDNVAVCVPYGKYRFTLTDGVGDGICCGQQGDGRYELYMDGRMMLYGSDFTYGKSKSHDIVAGYHTRFDRMSAREEEYLECHNWRRKMYHERFGSAYVPLEYDLSLAADAQKWADALLNDCNVNGIKHEPGVVQGENLAKNTGSGKWGQLYPVENICRRWFEREEDWGWPDNAHFTQGLWRSALYLGCAESQKSMYGGKGMCRIQVCRYARAGNCNMGKYQSNVGDNYKTPMLMEHNPCGPPCPPNGCH
ncbi:hypothetical protein ACHAWF_011970, partial [Thalassiosira exigua]